MAINPKTKGANGEREFCQWLFDNFNLESRPDRNLEQVRSGGCDVVCTPFAFEVKRREKFEFVNWWNQVSKAVKTAGSIAHGLEPVVAFRINKGDWEFLISAKHLGIPHGFLHCDRFVFRKWAEQFILKWKYEMEMSKRFLNGVDQLDDSYQLEKVSGKKLVELEKTRNNYLSWFEVLGDDKKVQGYYEHIKAKSPQEFEKLYQGTFTIENKNDE